MLEITSLDITPELAADKDSLALHAAMELEMFIEVNIGKTQPWTSPIRTETVAKMMARGKIGGNWAPLAFEFPHGVAELFIYPNPKSVQALKSLALKAKPIWKRRWTTEQNNAFAAAIVREMGIRLTLSSDSQSVRVALTLSSNRLLANEL